FYLSLPAALPISVHFAVLVSVSFQFEFFDLLNNVSHVNKEVVSGFEVKVLDSLVGNDLQRVSLLVMLRCQHSLFVSFVVPTHAAADVVGCCVCVSHQMCDV